MTSQQMIEDTVLITVAIPTRMRADVYNFIKEKHININDWLVDLIADEMHK